MLRPFQIEELNRMREFESGPLPDDPSFQTTFGWLGSCRGMGGKMVTMASYLNERVEPIRVEDRAWREVLQSQKPGGGPGACVQHPRMQTSNLHSHPTVSTTLIVVSSETSFEMDRWRDALERWAGNCRTVCVRSITDIKRLVPVRDRASLNADGLTSERIVDILQTSRVDILVVGASFVERYKPLLGHISWLRIVLNDGLTDSAIWKIAHCMSGYFFTTRFVWLIEALSEDTRLDDVRQVGMMTQNGRFTRQNWLELLCTNGLLPYLVIRTPDLVVQEQAAIVKHIYVEMFEPLTDEFRTPEFVAYIAEERLMNATFWVHLSAASIETLERSERWLEIVHKVLGPDHVLFDDEVEEHECPVCLNTERSCLVSCGHGMCRGCCAKLLMRGLASMPTCPLCRAHIDRFRVARTLLVEETVRQAEREIRIRVENDAYQAARTAGMRTVTQHVQSEITRVLEEDPGNQILLLCSSFPYFRMIEESIPHTPLHITNYDPPSRDARVYYASSRMFTHSMYRRFPFELSDVTHVFAVREPGKGDVTDELIDMLRVWSLARTKQELHFTFFEPEQQST